MSDKVFGTIDSLFRCVVTAIDPGSGSLYEWRGGWLAPDRGSCKCRWVEWKIPKKAQPLFDFSVQVFFGGLAFVAVLLIAVFIALVVKGVSALGIAPTWLLHSADIAERVIWGVDLFALALFLLGEIITLGRRMWKEWSLPHE